MYSFAFPWIEKRRILVIIFYLAKMNDGLNIKNSMRYRLICNNDEICTCCFDLTVFFNEDVFPHRFIL